MVGSLAQRQQRQAQAQAVKWLSKAESQADASRKKLEEHWLTLPWAAKSAFRLEPTALVLRFDPNGGSNCELPAHLNVPHIQALLQKTLSCITHELYSQQQAQGGISCRWCLAAAAATLDASLKNTACTGLTESLPGQPQAALASPPSSSTPAAAAAAAAEPQELVRQETANSQEALAVRHTPVPRLKPSARRGCQTKHSEAQRFITAHYKERKRLTLLSAHLQGVHCLC